MAVCKYCDRPLYWTQDDNGKWVPLDFYGDRHDCRERSD